MPTWLILITVLTVLVCVIAYVSDNMGKKLGKKRISLLGLRPRQTATALTMATSVAIMLVTLGVVMLFNKQVQRAFLRVDSIRERNQQLQETNRRLRRDTDALNARLETLQQSVSSSQNAARDANTKAYQAGRKATSARAELNTTRSRLTNVRSELTAAQAAVGEARRGEKVARAQVRSAQTRYTQAQSRAAEANSRAALIRKTLVQARSSLAQVNARRAQETARLSRIRTELGTVRQALSSTRQTVGASLLQAERSKLQSERLQKVVADLEQREAQQQTVVDRLEARRLELVQSVELASRVLSGDVAVPVGQMFAETTLPSEVNREQAVAALRSLLSRGSTAATALGFQALHLAPLRIESGREIVEYGEDQLINNLADYLTTFDVPVSVRLTAARAHGSGEPEILGRMLTVAVRPVFARNETISAAKVEGKQSDARLFNQLLKMVNQGEKMARERGAVPLLTEENPNFYANGTNERIFEALRQIQTHNGSVDVRLVAADNLTTVEPLRVRFEVGSPGMSSS